VAAQEGDGLVDVGALAVGELVAVGLDVGDQPPDPGDLLFRGHRLGAGPVVEIGCGEESFAASEQVVEVGAQVGQVGDVGAEVVAAGAAEPVGAGGAARGDVGRFGADAEGDGDLADAAAGVFGVEQGLRVTPDASAVPVELRATRSMASRRRSCRPALAVVSSLRCDINSRSTSIGTPASAWRWA
jgi:hypothetical protein